MSEEVIVCMNAKYWCGHDSTILPIEQFVRTPYGWSCTNCLSDAYDSTIEDYHWEG